MRKKIKRKYKTWWKKHWDEVILILGLTIGMYFFLKGMGAI